MMSGIAGRTLVALFVWPAVVVALVAAVDPPTRDPRRSLVNYACAAAGSAAGLGVARLEKRLRRGTTRCRLFGHARDYTWDGEGQRRRRRWYCRRCPWTWDESFPEHRVPVKHES